MLGLSPASKVRPKARVAVPVLLSALPSAGTEVWSLASGEMGVKHPWGPGRPKSSKFSYFLTHGDLGVQMGPEFSESHIGPGENVP